MASSSSHRRANAVSDIRSLQDLYNAGELDVHPDDLDDIGFAPDAGLNKRVSIWRGDITKLATDMIVNAANKSLLGGGGVDGAIHRAAGPELLEECETLGGAETGETKVTKGYDLPAKYIAHTVGPVWSRARAARCEAALQSCYHSSLRYCVRKKATSIGFSSISTGIYGFPLVEATEIALQTTREFLERDKTIERVIYVVFSKKDEDVYRRCTPIYFPPVTPSDSTPIPEKDPRGDDPGPDAPETTAKSALETPAAIEVNAAPTEEAPSGTTSPAPARATAATESQVRSKAASPPQIAASPQVVTTAAAATSAEAVSPSTREEDNENDAIEPSPSQTTAVDPDEAEENAAEKKAALEGGKEDQEDKKDKKDGE